MQTDLYCEDCINIRVTDNISYCSASKGYDYVYRSKLLPCVTMRGLTPTLRYPKPLCGNSGAFFVSKPNLVTITTKGE